MELLDAIHGEDLSCNCFEDISKCKQNQSCHQLRQTSRPQDPNPNYVICYVR